MGFHVFLSYDSADSALVDRVWRILNRMKIPAYMYERYPQYGQYLGETIKQMLKASRYVVVFWTQKGVSSQWVNQEVGIAIGVVPDFQSIVIPIQEKGIQVKGFTEHLLHIDYDPYRPELMILALLYELRKRLLIYQGPLALECSCGHEFEGALPSVEQINRTVEKNETFFCSCPKCTGTLVMSPYTLEIIKVEKPGPAWLRP